MNVALEEDYKLNGSTSWIHCIKFDYENFTHVNYHYHEYIEILYFLNGEGIVWVNGKCNKFSKNTLIIVSSQRAHALDILKPSEYICIKVMPEIFYSEKQFGTQFKYALPFASEIHNEYLFTECLLNDLSIGKLLSDIMEEWNKMEYGFDLIIKSRLLEFFSVVLRYLKSENLITDTTNIRPEIKDAIIYISNNYSSISEKEISKICHLSYNYFSYLFKYATGKTFKDYLLDTKIRQAEKLLLSTAKSITEISQETGFSTTSHFISQFKKKSGITPAKFRKIFLNQTSNTLLPDDK